MSFLKKLFGGGKPAAAPTEEHRGLIIKAAPVREGGQFRVAGTIVSADASETREHAFQRADRFQSMEEAVSMTFQKGRQIIDERRGNVFE